MRILITGAAGYIGNNLFKFLERSHDVFGFGLDTYKIFSHSKRFFIGDITNNDLVLSVISKIKPDIIIHAVAIKYLKTSDEDYDNYYNVNVNGVKNIVKAIKEVRSEYHKDIKLMFLSTDYVFDGNKGDYKETDIPSPSTIYGITKLKGEMIIQKDLTNFIIIRLSNVYLDGGNFYEYIKKNLENTISAEYYKDTIYSPIDIGSLKQIINFLLTSDLTGVLHVGGIDYLSRYDFAITFAKILEKDKNKLVLSAVRPDNVLIGKNQSLNTSKLKKLIPNIVIPTVEEALYVEHGLFVKPYFSFKDSRGSITGIFQRGHFEEINYVESKANIIRGNHYHRETDEIIHVLSGKMEVTLLQINGNILKEFSIKKGDTLYIRPNTAHRFRTQTNTKWINLLSKSMSTKDVQKDIVPLSN